VEEEDILYCGMGKNLFGITGGEGGAHSVVRNDQEPAHKVEEGVGADYVLCNLGQGLQEIVIIFLEWAKRICPHEIMYCNGGRTGEDNHIFLEPASILCQ
jgi:hypothetical protein